MKRKNKKMDKSMNDFLSNILGNMVDEMSEKEITITFTPKGIELSAHGFENTVDIVGHLEMAKFHCLLHHGKGTRSVESNGE